MAAKTWGGGGADNNWSTGGNWNGGTVPATSDSVTFNNTSVKNCTIDALGTWSGGSLTIASTYSGTITVSTTMSNIAAFSQAGGTWNSGSQTISFSSTWSLSGGTYTATSGTQTNNSSMTQTGSPTFNANGGTIKLNASSGSQTINCPNITFNLFTFSGAIGFTCSNGTTMPFGSNPSLTAGATQTITINGTISGTGTLTINTIAFTLGSTGSISGFTGIKHNPSSGTPAMTFTSGATIPANFQIEMGTTVSHTFDGGGLTFGPLLFDNDGGSGTVTIKSSNTWTNIDLVGTGSGGVLQHARTVLFQASKTQTFSGTFNARGVSGKLLTINSDTSGTAATLHTTGTLDICVDWVSLKDSTVDASPQWSGGANSTYGTNLTNWLQTACQRKLLAGAGSYTYTGNSASVLYDRTILAGAGSYAVTGDSASLLWKHILPAGSGVYVYTGDSALLARGYKTFASPGSYVYTGDPAALLWFHKILAAAGVYAVSGDSASVLAARLLKLVSGVYGVTGDAAALAHGYAVLAAAGSYGLTGFPSTGVGGKARKGSFPGAAYLPKMLEALDRKRKTEEEDIAFLLGLIDWEDDE